MYILSHCLVPNQSPAVILRMFLKFLNGILYQGPQWSHSRKHCVFSWPLQADGRLRK